MAYVNTTYGMNAKSGTITGMSHSSESMTPSEKPVIVAVSVLLVLYVLATVLGWTESPSSKPVVSTSASGSTSSSSSRTPKSEGEEPTATAPVTERSDGDSSGHLDAVSVEGVSEGNHGEGGVHGEIQEHGALTEVHADDHGNHDDGNGHHGSAPHLYAVLPFVLLLGAIAVFPLVPLLEHWWESNLHRFCVALGLAILTLGYYLFLYTDRSVTTVLHVLDHAFLVEYVPFIVLLFSLYTIAGGIRITGDLPAGPLTNAAFIGVGGLLASFVGTTGAAMLLIRPLLETNSERKFVKHTVVFFIFVVCNCGGCLLPIGDPPLFLGYLEGVSFLWTLHALWLPWLFTNVALIAIFLVWDTYRYRQEKPRDITLDETRVRQIRISGWQLNFPLLLGVVLCVALLDPKKPFLGTDWYPFLYLREVCQLCLVVFSLWWGERNVRVSNRFNYHAILEVAALFLGIFICMQPALQILNERGADLGINSGTKFFWFTGVLSSALDNAPTYLVFYKTAEAQFSGHLGDLVSRPGENPLAHDYLVAISLGAVFMGAMTYIGNGPNFMVKAIAEESGVRMPSFFGYMAYSVAVMVPVLLVVTWLFVH